MKRDTEDKTKKLEKTTKRDGDDALNVKNVATRRQTTQNNIVEWPLHVFFFFFFSCTKRWGEGHERSSHTSHAQADM